MANLAGKTLFITGASRGIGLAIGLRAARDGANVAIVAKSAAPHPRLPGTIHTAAAEIEKAGGRALALQTDIRFDDQVARAVDKTVQAFGGIDACVNNASAIALTDTLATDMKHYDLMQDINARGAFLVSKLCIPHLERGENPHILMLAPPPRLEPEWFAGHIAYTMAKFGMSLCALGLAEELKPKGIAVNALWPRTTIATAAIQNLLGGEEGMKASRSPAIMADAAHAILTRPARAFTGNFCMDDLVLAEAGVTDLDAYRMDPRTKLRPDLFVPDDLPPPGS